MGRGYRSRQERGKGTEGEGGGEGEGGNAATLLPTIQAHVLSCSIVHSDQWASYNRVSSIPGVAAHHNYSQPFRRICRFYHTQNIESYWNRAKT